MEEVCLQGPGLASLSGTAVLKQSSEIGCAGSCYQCVNVTALHCYQFLTQNSVLRLLWVVLMWCLCGVVGVGVGVRKRTRGERRRRKWGSKTFSICPCNVLTLSCCCFQNLNRNYPLLLLKTLKLYNEIRGDIKPTTCFWKGRQVSSR